MTFDEYANQNNIGLTLQNDKTISKFILDWIFYKAVCVMYEYFQTIIAILKTKAIVLDFNVNQMNNVSQEIGYAMVKIIVMMVPMKIRK